MGDTVPECLPSCAKIGAQEGLVSNHSKKVWTGPVVVVSEVKFRAKV